MNRENKIGVLSIKNLIWSMGLPVVLSMVLQAIYNVVDTIFVINMGNKGVLGNEALTYAFPIQLLIIAIGVGTGVGINAMLSQNLGEGNKEQVNKVAGNGIFISIIIYAAFLLFGLFGAKPYIYMLSKGNAEVAQMGTEYLRICCCASFGAVGYTVYERFLMATGKTMYSTAAQISGAVTNIVLDAVFIFVFGWGVAGAAWATVIGQIISLLIAMILHYNTNKEVDGSPKYIKPSWHTIKKIYRIGIPAAIMQGLLAVMMFLVIAVLKTIDEPVTAALMTGAYGIYYKIMQLALFAAFGLSNTLISIVSFNYGMKDKERVKQAVKYGIIDSAVVTLVIMVLFQIFALPVSNLFGLSIAETSSNGVTKADIINMCQTAMHIATIGYVFMGISVAVQGILQGFNNAVKPVIISFLRLIVFVIPFAYLFTLSENVQTVFWWTFPIAELLTAVISVLLLKYSVKEKIREIEAE